MVGSGLLTIPWGYSNSGLALGIRKFHHLKANTTIVITLISFLISYYTCYLVLKTAGTDTDYTDTLQKHFGRIGWIVGMTIFILNLFVPIIIYFQLLSQNLYPIIMAIFSIDRPITTDLDFSQFSYTYTCFIIMGLLLGLTLIRQLGIFVKFNTGAVVFIILIIVFIIYQGVEGFMFTTYVFKKS